MSHQFQEQPDFVSEVIDLEGVPVRLIDTAGIRPIEDPVEKVGWKSPALNGGSRFNHNPFDAATPLTQEDYALIKFLQEKNPLVVLNKTDLPVKLSVETLKAAFPQSKLRSISALQGEGVQELKGN